MPLRTKDEFSLDFIDAKVTRDGREARLWGADGPMAWVHVQVLGQLSCAGVFYLSTVDSDIRRHRYLYANHANAGSPQRLPADVVDKFGWERVTEKQAFYAPGKSSFADGKHVGRGGSETLDWLEKHLKNYSAGVNKLHWTCCAAE